MFIFGSIRQENLGDSLKSVVELRHIRFQDFLKTLRDLKRPLRVRICTLITQLWVIYELNAKIRGCLIRGAMIRGFSSFLDGVSSNLSKINSKNSFSRLHQL